MISLSACIAFLTIFCFSPIPVWHIPLHSFLPSWKRRPRAFYAVCAGEWALFLPIALHLTRRSEVAFSPSRGLKQACLGISLFTLGIALWSIKSLTPQRFFFWAVLRPDSSKPVVILSGPYRFVRHPAYLAIVLTVTAGFLVSGRSAVLEALLAISLLLMMVVGIEQRELEARLKGAAPEISVQSPEPGSSYGQTAAPSALYPGDRSVGPSKEPAGK